MSQDPWQQGMGGGGFGSGRLGAIARFLGDGENPLRWGFPVGKVLGIRVRIHVLFVIYILGQMIFTLPFQNRGALFVLPMLTALFLLVLLHEIGHCLTCRRVGGEADEIVMWPLGGLAMCSPPHNWKAELWTVLGGPAVNFVLFPVFAGVMYWLTDSWRVAIPNPISFGASIPSLALADDTVPWWLIVLWSFHTVNLMLLLFNMLIPMFPMDAGRVVQCVLWAKVGFHRSMWITVHVGLVSAALLATAGLFMQDGKMLLAIAVFGGVVCWTERKKIQFLGGESFDAVYHPGPDQDAKDDEPDPDETSQAEVDRVLEKISRVGVEGLTRRERRVLKRATAKSRDNGD